MATSVGLGIAGVAVAQALRLGPRATAAAFVIASAPDLDIPLGLLLEGDGGVYHRAWWSHSQIVAPAGAAVTLAGELAWLRLRVRRRRTREAMRWALLLGVVLLQQAGDLVFYGAISLLALRLLTRTRRRDGEPGRT